MNHTKTTTLGIAAAIAAVPMVEATETPLVTGHNAFASKVKVGDTKSKSIQAADNSQHCAFGAGSGAGNGPHTCDNRPTNTQTQTQNAGGTGTG